ncbi:MAG: hypothetical protein K9M54_04295 [Kiritimatiellales bacterium]|nr:hypothetical protein [Kiritimatiellales bacterium]
MTKSKFWIWWAGMVLFAPLSVVAMQTGETFTLKPEPLGGEEMVWYLIDWGDGIIMPTSHGIATFSPALSKVWRKPGMYKVVPYAITMSGTVKPLTETSVPVGGSQLDFPPFVEARQSDDPPASQEPYRPQSIELHFAKIEGLDALLLKKDPKVPFPDSFSIETSTDGGTVWNDVPSASYSHFPNPGSQVVWIPLHGVVANAVRVVSYKPPAIKAGTYSLRLGTLRAIGREPLFEMDADPKTAADWNNMWLAYGSAKNEVFHYFIPYPWPTDRPDEGGLLMIGSTIWAHWNAMKISWLDEPAASKYYENVVNSYPQDERGLMGVSPGSFLHLDHSKHYVTPAIFVAGTADWYLMHRDGSFLETKDRKTGVSLLEKMRKAMRYQLDDMDGKTGVLTIHDPEHDGTVNGMSGNYWDGWRFGYQSAYANMLFYQSLDWMAQLETALGNSDKAAEYAAVRPLVKQRFNEVFWNEKTGRFVGCIGKDGTLQDYGFTFVNLEAIASGIATPEHAEKTLQWLDGERIVKGDTSTGADIYYWKISPRANTLAAEAVTPSFWDGWTMKVGPGTIGEYGKQIQNGGHIFYVSYYDLMSRLKTRGIADAMKRMGVILDEFHKDNLRRKTSNKFGSTHVEGILREFPESGLVPLFFVNGILGIEPGSDGLHIEPALPDGWKFAAVNEYWFAGKKYRIRIERERTEPVVDGAQIRLPAEGRWVLSPDGEIRHAN